MSKSGWTPERKKRQAEMIKRWKPWEKSKGPKTLEGKSISKMNAYKHGDRSAEMINARKCQNTYWKELQRLINSL